MQTYEIQTTTDALFAVTELAEDDSQYYQVEETYALEAIADEIAWQGYERPRGLLLSADTTDPEGGMEMQMFEDPETGEIVGVTSIYLTFSGDTDLSDVPDAVFESTNVAISESTFYAVDTTVYPDITVTSDEMMETVKNNDEETLVCPVCGEGFSDDDYSTVEDDDGILYCSIQCLNEELT